MSAPPAFRQQLLAAIPRLRRYARSLVFDVQNADDLVQIVLERALGHWRQFDPRRDIVLWLLSIAHNAHLDALRRDRRLDVLPPERVTEVLDAQQPLGGDVGLRLDLTAALERLTPDQRSALLLVLVEQLSYAEAAEVLQVPAGTVMSRVSRARVAMREWLDGSAAPRSARVPQARPAPRGLAPPQEPHVPPRRLQRHRPQRLARRRARRRAPQPARRLAARATRGRRTRAPVGGGPRRAARAPGPGARRAGAAGPGARRLAASRAPALGPGRHGGRPAGGRGPDRCRRHVAMAGPARTATLAAARVADAAGTPAGWVQRAALAHSVYVPEPRHPIEVKAQEEHLARWLTRRIDIPVKLFDLRDEGFELMGGRLLPDAGGKSAQLMYESLDPDAPKQRVTVYLRKPDAAAPTAFSYRQQGELGQFYWVEAGAGYALVGALPKERLLALAQAIYKQQPSAQPQPAHAAR